MWLATVGAKRRPVVVLTRSEVIDVRGLITVAEVSTNARGLAAEVPMDHEAVGLDRPSTINCDGLHTVPKASLTHHVGEVDTFTMQLVCQATAYALGC